jgi:hypothetical protein
MTFLVLRATLGASAEPSAWRTPNAIIGNDKVEETMRSTPPQLLASAFIAALAPPAAAIS